MKTIHYADGSDFELSEEEFNSFAQAIRSKEVPFVKRLGVFLSGNFIWAGEKPADKTKGYLHDGLYVEKRFGRWVDPTAPNAILDPTYYPEIAKDEVLTESPKALIAGNVGKN